MDPRPLIVDQSASGIFSGGQNLQACEGYPIDFMYLQILMSWSNLVSLKLTPPASFMAVHARGSKRMGGAIDN